MTHKQIISTLSLTFIKRHVHIIAKHFCLSSLNILKPERSSVSVANSAHVLTKIGSGQVKLTTTPETFPLQRRIMSVNLGCNFKWLPDKVVTKVNAYFEAASCLHLILPPLK